MPTYQQFPLPDAGEGLTEAEIVAWHVAVGDVVTVNQTIVEIETAKSLVDLPSPWSGVVTKILVEPGQTVDVGTPIIEVDTDPAGTPADDGAAYPESQARIADEGSAIEHGHRGRPNRHQGVEPGGSDEIEAARAGRAGDGEPATTATSRAVPAVAAAAPASTDAEEDDVPEAPVERKAVLVGYGVAEAGTGRRERAANGANPGNRPHALAKPPVRKLARELGVDLDSVSPTGPGGIVTREDVLGRAAQAEARTLATYPGDDAPWLASGTVSPDGRQTRVPVKSVRKRTAEAMVASAFSAPHVTVFHTIDVTATMKLVERLRGDREFADIRVTPLLIAAKALMLAVRRHPEINGSWDEQSQEIVYKHYINLGIAAATPRGPRRAEHQGRAPAEPQGAGRRARRAHRARRAPGRPRRPTCPTAPSRSRTSACSASTRARRSSTRARRRSSRSGRSVSSRGCTRARSRSVTSRSSRSASTTGSSTASSGRGCWPTSPACCTTRRRGSSGADRPHV